MKKLIKRIALFVPLLSVVSCSNNEQSTSKEDKNFLVTYFSITKNTESVATTIKSYLNCDLFEIEAKVPYVDSDLQYDDSCRSATEQNDSTSRPEVKNTISNLANYDVIFLGYPIWYGIAPRVVYTFIETQDFTNKTIIPFCTSDNTDITSSENDLAKLATTSNWVKGHRFTIDETNENIVSWVNTLNLL